MNMNTRIYHAWIFAAVWLLGAPGFAMGRATWQGTDISVQPSFKLPYHNMLDGGLYGNFTPVSTNVGTTTGSMTFFSAKKEVTIEWVYFVAGYGGGLRDRPGYARRSQEFTLSYTPTSVASHGPNQVLVAGVDDSGTVLIEEWVFKDMSSVAMALELDGTARVPELKAEFQSNRLVYRAPLSGCNFIVSLFHNWANPKKPFFLTGESQKVMQLDLGALGSYSWVASHDGSDGLTVPELVHAKQQGGFSKTHSGVHPQFGAVYWAYETRGRLDALVLVDGDMDGELDGSFTVTDWSTSPLRNRAEFTQYR